MTKHELALRSFSDELINCLEGLKTKREELQNVIDIEELEKAKLQGEIELFSNRLSALMSSLAAKTAARADFDRAIVETETALCRLLENSQAVVNIVRREMSTLSGDEIMKTIVNCPVNQQMCMIEPGVVEPRSAEPVAQQHSQQHPQQLPQQFPHKTSPVPVNCRQSANGL